ncbi:MAG: HicB family protein [Planctomycetales bacterium 4484_113]|nr:MAG: HicB family protein [Planctomycetales bacterium 4484_113]
MPQFTLEYWVDEGWHVGRLKEVPGVFSQGRTLAELKENIREAYALMMEDETPAGIETQTEAIAIEL